MFLFPCKQCFSAVRVIPDSVEESDQLIGESSDFWPDKYPCVVCGALGEGMLERDADISVFGKLKVRDLTAQEFFSALHGLGTPDEMHCDLVTVRELFAQKKVRTVSGRDVAGTTRSVVDLFEFDDGTRLFLGASPSGAVVYRIARPISYTQKALDADR